MNRSEYDHSILMKIGEHGFTLIGVFDPEKKLPTFVYSIGLTERGWPEVLFIGNLNPAIIEILLTDLIEGWVKAGEVKMGDNPDLIAFGDGTSHALRVVDIPLNEAISEYGCQVPYFYPDMDIRFVQALWPDKAGKFPDEEGYNTSMTQPIVGRG